MRYHLSEMSTALNLPDRYFLSREKGEIAYAILHEAVYRLDDQEPLVLVFPPDQLIDASFADEAIIRLYETLMADEAQQHTLLLEGLTPDSIHNIDAVIHLRNVKLAMLAVHADGTWQIIGQLERSLLETLNMVADVRMITAAQLGEAIQAAINTASNRLKRLYDSRLIRREEQRTERGLQYVYHFWQWE